MAVPQNAVINRSAPLKTGILLGVSPSSDPTFNVEIARATSSGVYATVATLTPKGGGIPVTFEDILPVDNYARSYKARAVKDGWNPGSYTAVVTVKPVYLPEIAPNITPLTGQQIGAPLFMSTAAPAQYGNVAAPSAYQRSLSVYPFEFMSTANSVSYTAGATGLYPTSTSARAFFWKSLIAQNSSVSEVVWQYRRISTKGSLRLRIQTFTPNAGGITATFLDYTATGTTGKYTKTFSSGFGIGVLNVYARVDITSTSGSAASAQHTALAFAYTQPNVGVGV